MPLIRKHFVPDYGRMKINKYVSCSPGFGIREVFCGACPSHYYSSDRIADCLKCHKGFYQPIAGSENCVKCLSPFSRDCYMICIQCRARINVSIFSVCRARFEFYQLCFHQLYLLKATLQRIRDIENSLHFFYKIVIFLIYKSFWKNAKLKIRIIIQK